MDFPRPNFSRLRNIRIPERLRNVHVPARLRNVLPEGLTSRIGYPQGLSAAGGLTLPYKLAVVAVMMLVTGGTLVTFGSAGAETAGKPGTVSAVGAVAAASGSVLPGTSEVVPRVEGQILPETTYDYSPDNSILSANDLLTNLKLTDYSPKSKSDDKKKSDDDKKSDDKKNDDKKPTAASKNNSGNKADPKTDPKTNNGKTDDGKTDEGGSDGKSDDGGDDKSDDGGDDKSDDGGDDKSDDDGDDKSDDDGDHKKCKDAKSELVKKLCK